MAASGLAAAGELLAAGEFLGQNTKTAVSFLFLKKKLRKIPQLTMIISFLVDATQIPTQALTGMIAEESRNYIQIRLFIFFVLQESRFSQLNFSVKIGNPLLHRWGLLSFLSSFLKQENSLINDDALSFLFCTDSSPWRSVGITFKWDS